jgi:hypothetical protein
MFLALSCTPILVSALIQELLAGVLDPDYPQKTKPGVTTQAVKGCQKRRDR